LMVVYALVLLVLGAFLAIVVVTAARRVWLSDFEARQRGIVRTSEGEVVVPARPQGRPMGQRVRESVGMAMDLRYLSESVGGFGEMRGTLYIGVRPQAGATRVRTSGGVVVCPLCGMPMERIGARSAEELHGILPRPEPNQDIWRCMHEYPVFFVPSLEPGRPAPS